MHRRTRAHIEWKQYLRHSLHSFGREKYGSRYQWLGPVIFVERNAEIQWCFLADLTSMMMQCSDLSASAKTARSFAKKSAVNQVQRAKITPTVTYTESRSARQWSSDQSESLTELFTLPGMHLVTFYFLRRRLAIGEGIVVLTMCVCPSSCDCMPQCHVSLSGEQGWWVKPPDSFTLGNWVKPG